MTKFVINKLDNTHQRQNFSCGISSLDDYIHQKAGQDTRRFVAVTYILNDATQNNIAGYYTLSATSLELTGLPDNETKKLPHYPVLPATKIGRLAIDNRYQKQGLGEILLLNALQRAHQHSKEIASFAAVVDAINENALTFYEKYGFVSLKSNKKTLFLTMKTIAQLKIVPIDL